MSLLNAQPGVEYRISGVETGDGEMDAFLLSLGCCPGQTIALVSRRKNNLVVAIKDGRYHLDAQLAQAISVG